MSSLCGLLFSCLVSADRACGGPTSRRLVEENRAHVFASHCTVSKPEAERKLCSDLQGYSLCECVFTVLTG